jgi:hypothetical protein
MKSRRSSSRSARHPEYAKLLQAVSWSFAKDSRFKSPSSAVRTEYNTNLGPTTSHRAPSFGYGKRWEPKSSRGLDSPPPTTYRCPSLFDEPKVAGKISPPPKTFKRLKRPMMPGPGTYNITRPIGFGAPMITLKSRNHLNKRSETPSPGEYRPSSVLTEKRCFHDISFGVGERRPYYNIDNASPGPGSYDPPTSFSRLSPERSRLQTPRSVSALGLR